MDEEGLIILDEIIDNSGYLQYGDADKLSEEPKFSRKLLSFSMTVILKDRSEVQICISDDYYKDDLEELFDGAGTNVQNKRYFDSVLQFDIPLSEPDSITKIRSIIEKAVRFGKIRYFSGFIR